MKNLLSSLSLLVVLSFTSCSKQESGIENSPSGPVLVQKKTPASPPQGDPYTKSRLDDHILSVLQSANGFQWDWMDLKTIWSALQTEGGLLAIGYKPAGEGDVSGKLHSIRVGSGEWKAVHDALLEFIREELSKTSGADVAIEDFLVEDDPVLPVITVRLTDKQLLTKLASLENIRYLEPLGYWPAQVPRSTSGCSGSSTVVNTADYISTLPAALQPWNYALHQVPGAWNNAQGSGMTIGVIDAGLSSTQSLLGSMFNNGYSNVGRVVTTDYTFGTSAFTNCTHGTSMAALALGPRNNLGAPSGVAYKSNLHFIRAAEDVVLDLSSEISAVKSAFVKMGNRQSVKIISLSMGTPFGSSVLKDGVDYAYGKGKIIFAAAGTSFGLTSWWGVIYPAAYSSCLAVTGVKESGGRCSSCHDGGAVIYTITMERDVDNSRNTLSLKPSGYAPAYVGGSSCATAMAAGIAATVWSAKPTMTRAQLQTCLTNTSQFYPTRTSTKGYGNLNASAAVNFALTNY